MSRFLVVSFLILLVFLLTGCAEFLEDYSYSTGADTYTKDASASGTRDPFKDYGTFGPANTSDAY
ncbi:MAG: hypothetical protein HY586_01230 [Candidatus Omnitrophica bacterium]|nr:hypothetical protein [Candidatus Omnitrophota bacterium]